MSENLWADFDKKISELSTKADELDGLRVRLAQLPERLKLIKDKTETLLLSAKGTMSESLKKEIAKKVQALDAIFNKLQSTKNLSEPLLQKLEGELKNLEDFADSSSVKMDERAQKQSVDVIPPPVERKLLDLVPPTQSGYVNPIGTDTIATSSKDAVVKPGPPEGTKYDYLAKKAAAKAKATPIDATASKLNAKAKPYEPKNANVKARETGVRASISQGEGKKQPPWNSSTKFGGFLSSKKYSHKRRNRKLKSQKRAKLMKRKSKAHKKKASTRRR